MAPAGRKVRVLVADHYPIVRRGVRTLLENDGGFEVVGETSDGHQALELCARLTVDVLLLDLRTSGLSGVETLRELAGSRSAVRVVLLADALDDGLVAEAIRLGAQGIVFKESAPDLLLAAIRCVAAGQCWVDRHSINELAGLLRDEGEGSLAGNSGSGLTARERDVVAAVVDGCSNREIAERLSLSEVTVKHHLTSIFTKAGISSRSELVAHALQGQLASGAGPVASRSVPADVAGSRGQQRRRRAHGPRARRHLGAGSGAPSDN